MTSAMAPAWSAKSNASIGTARGESHLFDAKPGGTAGFAELLPFYIDWAVLRPGRPAAACTQTLWNMKAKSTSAAREPKLLSAFPRAGRHAIAHGPAASDPHCTKRKLGLCCFCRKPHGRGRRLVPPRARVRRVRRGKAVSSASVSAITRRVMPSALGAILILPILRRQLMHASLPQPNLSWMCSTRSAGPAARCRRGPRQLAQAHMSTATASDQNLQPLDWQRLPLDGR